MRHWKGYLQKKNIFAGFVSTSLILPWWWWWVKPYKVAVSVYWYSLGTIAILDPVTLSLALSFLGATLSMRSLVKEEPDWRTSIMTGDRAGIVSGPLRLRRGSRFTWRKECQSIMERLASLIDTQLNATVWFTRQFENLAQLLKCHSTVFVSRTETIPWAPRIHLIHKSPWGNLFASRLGSVQLYSAMCFSQMITPAAQPAFVTSAVKSAGNMQTGEQQEGNKGSM